VLAAAAIFVAVGNLSVVGLAGVAYLLGSLSDARRDKAALAEPVAAFPHPRRYDPPHGAG
jgi:hypothetical protein